MRKLTFINNAGRQFLSGILVLVFMLATTGYAFCQSPDKLFGVATELYKNKKYDQAIEAYQKLISQGYRNAAVYYNLGNCYYKTDQISASILNYERALRLAPSDDDIRFNLRLANLKTIDRLSPVPQLSLITKWETLVASQSSKTWGIYSICCVWLGLIGFAIYLFVDGIRRWAFFSGSVLLLFAIFFFSLSYTQNQAEYGAGQAILTTPNTYIKSAPDASSTDLFLVHEGIKLNLLDKVGDWSKVRLADGKVGWIEQNNYAVI